jgi:hypothetical protein
MTRFPWPENPVAQKLSSTVLDNGAIHWGAGMPGSLCGTFDPGRKEEVNNRAKVTCKKCIRILKSRP